MTTCKVEFFASVATVTIQPVGPKRNNTLNIAFCAHVTPGYLFCCIFKCVCFLLIHLQYVCILSGGFVLRGGWGLTLNGS